MSGNFNLKKCLRLYAVTDRSWAKRQTLLKQIELVLSGGATLLQLREKELNFEAFLQEAKSAKKICQKFDVPLIVNDNVEVAIYSGADGVHIGQGDMKLKEVRKFLGPSKIIGVSVHTPEEALVAEKDGADYLGVGSIFPTSTKVDASMLSLKTLAEICKIVSVPVVAIGGINSQNISTLANSGVVGIAVISAIFSQRNIPLATYLLKQQVEEIFK